MPAPAESTHTAPPTSAETRALRIFMLVSPLDSHTAVTRDHSVRINPVLNRPDPSLSGTIATVDHRIDFSEASILSSCQAQGCAARMRVPATEKRGPYLRGTHELQRSERHHRLHSSRSVHREPRQTPWAVRMRGVLTPVRTAEKFRAPPA